MLSNTLTVKREEQIKKEKSFLEFRHLAPYRFQSERFFCIPRCSSLLFLDVSHHKLFCCLIKIKHLSIQCFRDLFEVNVRQQQLGWQCKMNIGKRYVTRDSSYFLQYTEKLSQEYQIHRTILRKWLVFLTIKRTFDSHNHKSFAINHLFFFQANLRLWEQVKWKNFLTSEAETFCLRKLFKRCKSLYDGVRLSEKCSQGDPFLLVRRHPVWKNESSGTNSPDEATYCLGKVLKLKKLISSLPATFVSSVDQIYKTNRN